MTKYTDVENDPNCIECPFYESERNNQLKEIFFCQATLEMPTSETSIRMISVDNTTSVDVLTIDLEFWARIEAFCKVTEGVASIARKALDSTDGRRAYGVHFMPNKTGLIAKHLLIDTFFMDSEAYEKIGGYDFRGKRYYSFGHFLDTFADASTLDGFEKDRNKKIENIGQTGSGLTVTLAGRGKKPTVIDLAVVDGAFLVQ